MWVYSWICGGQLVKGARLLVDAGFSVGWKVGWFCGCMIGSAEFWGVIWVRGSRV